MSAGSSSIWWTLFLFKRMVNGFILLIYYLRLLNFSISTSWISLWWMLLENDLFSQCFFFIQIYQIALHWRRSIMMIFVKISGRWLLRLKSMEVINRTMLAWSIILFIHLFVSVSTTKSSLSWSAKETVLLHMLIIFHCLISWKLCIRIWLHETFMLPNKIVINVLKIF